MLRNFWTKTAPRKILVLEWQNIYQDYHDMFWRLTTTERKRTAQILNIILSFPLYNSQCAVYKLPVVNKSRSRVFSGSCLSKKIGQKKQTITAKILCVVEKKLWCWCCLQYRSERIHLSWLTTVLEKPGTAETVGTITTDRIILQHRRSLQLLSLILTRFVQNLSQGDVNQRSRG